eukprot:TRINITY_DN11879_c0_g1_i1.p1 TRINITY_DN11879_c0_g1~~TRINITY_DN11879_c0_g1_i1.p1  ORF type:complete len:418 (-),score=50.95 TRINITY_DN11879_c0_g1_i1:38-1249(-)
MADESPSVKRARSEHGALNAASLLEEGVRLLVAQALSSLSSSSAASLAGANPCQQELAACRTEIAVQNNEISDLKQELQATRNLVQSLHESIKGLKLPLASSGQNSAAQVPSAELEGTVSLKVGSRKFPTTAETLRTFPESFFGLMVSGRVPQKREKDGSIFIDRNPKHFSFVLDYLRSGGEGFTPPTSSSAQDELRAEADFYGLPGLVAMLRRLHVLACHLMSLGKKGSVLSGQERAAAMLDVQDPHHFSVTFAFGTLGASRPFFVGVAPLETHLPSEWVKRQVPDNLQNVQGYGKEWECPPALDEGLFFFFMRGGEHAGLVTASGGKIQFEKMDYYGGNGSLESVRMCFHSCKITFYAEFKRRIVTWDTSIPDHRLPTDRAYRPVLFFRESGTCTISDSGS